MNHANLWKLLKTGRQVEIHIDKSQHKKVARRLRHESHKDKGFRLVCAEKSQAYKFVTVSFPDILIVRLEFSTRHIMPKRFL